jgi:hypothetical protein
MLLEKHDIDLIIEIELENYIRVAELGYNLNLLIKQKHSSLIKVLTSNLQCKTTKKELSKKHVEDALAEEIITLK